MNFFKNFKNEKELNSKFPNEGISMEGLLLLGIEYRPGNKLNVSLLQKTLPNVFPERWKLGNVEGLRLDFDLGALSLKFKVPNEIHEMPILSVLIEKTDFKLLDEVANVIELDVVTFYMQLKISPVYEFGEC